MLSVSSLRISKDEFESQREMEGLGMDSVEFSDGNLLESIINFDELFVSDGDVLPDLEMDPEILADFSVCGEESSTDMNSSSVSLENNNNHKIESDDHQNQNITVKDTNKEEDECDREYENKVCSASASGISDSNSGSSTGGGDREEIVRPPSPKEASKARKKSSAQSKASQGKRKVKVDWSPELHRRFVEAVEQLGVDNAVPSKILEIMGVACLTRHNIASHLQKYRSHRKHLVAREAEAARWRSERRERYGGKRKVLSPWVAVAPSLGYPHHMGMHHFRALHVWGHPPTPPHPSFWHHPQAPNALTQATGTHCFSQPLAATRFGSPPVPGIPPHAMFTVDPGVSLSTGQPGPDFHPSKESIDEAIEDVLSKPWLPLPLGLKAPALDSVLSELQRQGIPKIPPSCTASPPKL